MRLRMLAIAGLWLAAEAQLARAQGNGIDFFLALSSQNATQQRIDPTGALASRALPQRGVEGWMIASSGSVGLYGRHLDGGGSRRLQSTEGGILLGGAAFKLEAIYARRTHTGLDTTFQYLRGGLSTVTRIGASGVALRFRGGYYVPWQREDGRRVPVEGWEGETALTFTYPRWRAYPITGSLGYRMERFAARGWDEQVGAVTLGLGMWYGAP